MDNPYSSPFPDENKQSKPGYTRFRLLLDIFAILLPVFLVIFRVIHSRVYISLLDLEINPVGCAVFLISTLALWAITFGINTYGSIKGRPVSIVGLLLNVSFIAMAVFHIQ
jgi:hypothetical protein